MNFQFHIKKIKSSFNVYIINFLQKKKIYKLAGVSSFKHKINILMNFQFHIEKINFFFNVYIINFLKKNKNISLRV
jgi:hypothetical protein